jgi:hypothetical protein
MQVLTNDGCIFTGTAREIIDQMRQAGRLDMAQSNAEFMADVASRAHLWNAARIRTMAPEKFLYDLAEADLLCIVEE